jgi:RNA polymerase sigma-70 factor (ECF subfamily)
MNLFLIAFVVPSEDRNRNQAKRMERERSIGTEDIHALVREIQTGNREAFMTIVGAYQQRVFVMAYSMLRNKEDALDVVQETFLRLFQKAKQFKEGCNFQGWLLQIAKNLCVDYYRKNYRKRREFESPKSLDELQVAAEPDPASLSAGEMRDVFFRSIDKLASRQRMVFVLRHVDELQFNEISETLNISVGTVKSLHFKAVQNLRKWLSPYMGITS